MPGVRLPVRAGRFTVIALGAAILSSLLLAGAAVLNLSAVILLIAVLTTGVTWLATFTLLGIYVFAAPSAPGATNNWASYRLMLSAFVFATIVSNVIVVGYLALAGRLATLTSGQAQAALSPDVLVVAVVSLQCCLGSFLYVRLVRPGILTWTEMGFTGRGLGRQIGLGLLLGLGVIVLLAAASALLRLLGIQQNQAEMYAGIRGAHPLWFAAFFIASAGIAPLIEEAYFRGYVFRACLSAKGPRQAYAVSATLFALAHVNLPAFVPFVVFGLAMAYVVQRTRTIGPAVVGHAVNNGMVVLVLYFVSVAPPI